MKIQASFFICNLCGMSSIAVSLRSSHVILVEISGKLFNREHPLRSRRSRDSRLTPCGRISRTSSPRWLDLGDRQLKIQTIAMEYEGIIRRRIRSKTHERPEASTAIEPPSPELHRLLVKIEAKSPSSLSLSLSFLFSGENVNDSFGEAGLTILLKAQYRMTRTCETRLLFGRRNPCPNQPRNNPSRTRPMVQVSNCHLYFNMRMVLIV
ncbi:hypothetical protein F2Q70_00017735 [Brassica cretica]|uniref:Uncharacterized protein n=1 Tax=Brassica cretica TaxID=69181 RepID=A0A8S9HZP9_BRACR|nr:hypothetical protein F2Q70_00017735 [Brassica cretica]